MLFSVKAPVHNTAANAIARAVEAIDASASVRVDRDSGEIRIEGRLSPQQAKAAIKNAGYDACAVTDTESVQSSGSSNCCGCCSQ